MKDGADQEADPNVLLSTRLTSRQQRDSMDANLRERTSVDFNSGERPSVDDVAMREQRTDVNVPELAVKEIPLELDEELTEIIGAPGSVFVRTYTRTLGFVTPPLLVAAIVAICVRQYDDDLADEMAESFFGSNLVYYFCGAYVLCLIMLRCTMLSEEHFTFNWTCLVLAAFLQSVILTYWSLLWIPGQAIVTMAAISTNAYFVAGIRTCYDPNPIRLKKYTDRSKCWHTIPATIG